MPFDAKTELLLGQLYPAFALGLKNALEAAEEVTGRAMKLTEGVRSFPRQTALFAQGRSVPGPGVSDARPMGYTVTDAQAGLSGHHYGVAGDCAFVGDDPYLAKEEPAMRNTLWDFFGKSVRDAGLTWGGTWGGAADRPHAESFYGFRVGDLKAFFNRGGMELVWRQLDLARKVPVGEDWDGRTLFDPTK